MYSGSIPCTFKKNNRQSNTDKERGQSPVLKKSLIKNDCNDWSREHNKPRYILDLLLSVINVSLQTVDIVKRLPKLKFD